MMRFRYWLLICSLLVVGGCQTGTLPNPNDPNDVGSLTPENMKDQFTSISEMLQVRLAHRQITNQEFKELLGQAADHLLKGFTPDKTEPATAWQIAEIMINAKHWQDAEQVLVSAIEWAKVNHNEDRFVNDTLRLARVRAELGQVSQAVKTARTVFSIPAYAAVPILYATQSEIVPAGRGKGHDLELGKLLEDAIAIDLKATVNPDTIPGQGFLSARPYHVYESWVLVTELYTNANRPDLAAMAQKKVVEYAAYSHRGGHLRV